MYNNFNSFKYNFIFKLLILVDFFENKKNK